VTGLLAILLFCCLAAACGSTMATNGSTPRVLLSGKHQFWWPQVSGHTVVWMDDRHSSWNTDIYGYDLETHREFPICVLSSRQSFPRISGNVVVWSDWRNVAKSAINTPRVDPDIWGYDLRTRREFPICRAKGAQGGDAISGDLVAWVDGRNRRTSGDDIYAYDLATKKEFPVCTAPGDQLRPAVSGNHIVWADYRGTTITGVGAIYLLDVSTGRRSRISPPGEGGDVPQIDGQTVIWQNLTDGGHPGFYVYDLATRRTRFVDTGSSSIGWYTLSGGTVLWVDEDKGVFGLHLGDGSRFVVARGAWATQVAASGDLAVWQNFASGKAPSDVNQLVLDRLEPTRSGGQN
jgi:TolB protein